MLVMTLDKEWMVCEDVWYVHLYAETLCCWIESQSLNRCYVAMSMNRKMYLRLTK